jgi:ABC-type multidrug transport system fused ATPase/permease subunit
MPTTPPAGNTSSFLGDDVTKSKLTAIVSEHARTARGRLGGDEHRVVGILDFGLYHEYFNAAWDWNGTFVFATILFFITCAQIASCASDIWLAEWAEASEDAIDDDTTLTYAENMFYIEYFLLILGVVVIFAFIKAVFYMSTAYRSGKRLHAKALDKLVNAPVHEYFDVEPTGRILNRFSKDLDAVDLLLVDFLFEFLETAIFIIALLIVCAISVPEMLIIFFPLTYLFYKTRQTFSKSSRELKRIESTSRSPVFSTFNETVTGLAHIRAYGEEDVFRKLYCDRLDTHLKTTFHLNNITPWNIIRLDLVGSLVVLTIAVCIVTFEGSISETLSALALAYSVQLESRLTEAVWKSIETENYMTQMERLEHFQHIPQESQDGDDVDALWPKEGKLEFENVDFRYRADLPDVLHKVSFEVLPEERLGICGRTGSGKSSLMVVLFRLGELGCDELGRSRGTIRIDGVDISQIKLKDLRSRISIIPQIPWLFKGTMRDNLDPSGTKSDPDIWTALKHVQLEAFVRSQGGLDYEIVERGANLSQGQRQLLCIARALVRKSQVVMMDEATANIDSATDKEIQQTIRTSFSQYTTLTIAHRLSTIADSDRILVLNNGHVVEHDAPHRLLNATFERPIGFAALVRELAPESMQDIKKIASAAATHRGELAML